MTSSDHLLTLIQSTPDINGLLRSSFGFGIGRKRKGDLQKRAVSDLGAHSHCPAQPLPAARRRSVRAVKPLAVQSARIAGAARPQATSRS